MTEHEAIRELAHLVAWIAQRSWQALGTDDAGQIIERCEQIRSEFEDA